LHHVVWQKFTNISEVLTASIIRALMIEAVNTSEAKYPKDDAHLIIAEECKYN
jgi:hypothetical protein